MTDKTQPKPRRTAREPNVSPQKAPQKQPSRLDQLQDLLMRDGGASIAEMVTATGWQQHSVRGAMAGALKKRGLIITSEKTDGVRRYTGSRPA
jgi:hypothetical protein